MRTNHFAGAAIAATLLLLSGCAAAHAAPAPQPSTSSPTSVHDLVMTSPLYNLTDAEVQKCKVPPISTRLLAADSTDQITKENSRLALPDSMGDASPAEVAAQEKAWENLSPDDRLFQLCLPLAQSGALGNLKD